MPPTTREIIRSDILSPELYSAQRQDLKQRIIEIKKSWRVSVGADATFYFENYDTMWMQIQEMLHIEKGGEPQILDELAVYNPLVPKGRELVATLMFEIEDEGTRARELGLRGGVEHTVTLKVGEWIVAAQPDGDVERTNAVGKTSAVHFFHFPFTDQQVDAFRNADAEVILGFGHENYAHMAVIPKAVREALAEDFS
jgi:hypothetical protein